MIRKLMASTAMLALISAGALTATAAETQKPVVQQDVTAAPAADTATVTAEGVLTPDQPTLASVFIGRSVYSSADPESDNIGDVNDLIVAEDGSITHAVIGVGGFLGIGEKDVAVPFDKLQVVEKDGDVKLIYSATREELEAAPALDRTAYDPIARYSQEQAAKASTDTGLAPATTASTDVPAADTLAAPADQQTAAIPVPSEETPAPAAETTTEQTAAADTSSLGEVVTPPTAPDATTTAEATAPATDEQAAGAPMADQLANAPVEANQAASDGEEFLTFGPHQVRASTLIGMTVYGAADDNVGEVSDIVLQSDGQTRAALIDVGGFLGIGEKTVAIPFTDLHFTEVQDGAATDGTPVSQIKLSMSKEQLEQLPAYQEPEQQAAAASSDVIAPVDQMAAPADQTATTTVPVTEPAPDSQMAAAPSTGAVDGQTADESIVTGSVATDYQPAGQELKASELMGLSVYGPGDVSVGEIGDVVFDENGSIQAIVIDAGGFLGIAEKPVAINFQDLSVRRDENGSLIAMVNKSKEQFDAAPAYQVTGTTDAGTTVQ